MSGTRTSSGGGLFSPLAKSLLDGFGEAVILFDPDGRITYANARGQRVLDRLSDANGVNTRSLLPRLGRMGARIERVETGTVTVGHAVYVAVPDGEGTLADQERRAILEALNATGWRYTETARRLGISRTTLWRRLRTWGIEPPPEVTAEQPPSDGDPDTATG